MTNRIAGILALLPLPVTRLRRGYARARYTNNDNDANTKANTEGSGLRSVAQGEAIVSNRALVAISALIPLLLFANAASALHVIPDQLGDQHFTSGPCPESVPSDGAVCPNGTATCPAFYNPALLPSGYNSVSYCATVLPGAGSGITVRTMPLDAKEQKAFLVAAQKVESYVKDDRTVVVEAYKVACLDSGGNNNVCFLGNEYWNPVCAADALLPPFSVQSPTIVQNIDGSYSYQNLPETYSPVLNALKSKNAANQSPMALINYLPDQSHINVEWPASFYGWQFSTNYSSDLVSNFQVGTAAWYPVTPGAKPFTLCGSPATMKMLGLAPLFQKNGHTIDDINAPQANVNVTLPGTDGAIVIPDFTVIPPATPTFTWIYDSKAAAIVNTQLPRAYFDHALNRALQKLACDDPTQCQFPQGANGGRDLVGVFNHEINHILGVMQSQYYKIPYEGTALAYAYGTALYLLDLFDLDSDYVVPGFGHPGIQSNADFTLAPRNNDASEPDTVVFAPTAAGLTPWIQFGSRDHLMVYKVDGGAPRYFPLMNGGPGLYNPDGDIQKQFGETTLSPQFTGTVFIDPLLSALPWKNVVHINVQGASLPAVIAADTIREYSELAAQGWNVDYSTLSSEYDETSPLAKWYQTCFDANGAFTTSKNSNCRFSVTPQALQFLQ